MDKIKDWFLKDPKRIKAFADAQEAFKQATEQRFLDALIERLCDKGYKFKGKPDASKTDYSDGRAELFPLEEEPAIHMLLCIERYNYELYYGFLLTRGQKPEGWRKSIVNLLGEEHESPSWLWNKNFYSNESDLKEKIIDLAACDEKLQIFADKCVKEITDSIEILKNSKQFQDCTWLV